MARTWRAVGEEGDGWEGGKSDVLKVFDEKRSR